MATELEQRGRQRVLAELRSEARAGDHQHRGHRHAEPLAEREQRGGLQVGDGGPGRDPLGAGLGAGERRVEIAAGDGGGLRAGRRRRERAVEIRVRERAARRRARGSRRRSAGPRSPDAVAGGQLAAPARCNGPTRTARRTPRSASSASDRGRAGRANPGRLYGQLPAVAVAPVIAPEAVAVVRHHRPVEDRLGQRERERRVVG